MRAILNVMCPESNKSLSRQGWGHSLLESGLAIPFLPQDSVVRVNLSCLSHNAADTAGWCLRQKGEKMDERKKREKRKMHKIDGRKTRQVKGVKDG